MIIIYLAAALLAPPTRLTPPTSLTTPICDWAALNIGESCQVGPEGSANNGFWVLFPLSCHNWFLGGDGELEKSED